LQGEIDVAGPNLAGSLTSLGLIDEYRLYIHPIVLGSGQPFFAGPRDTTPTRHGSGNRQQAPIELKIATSAPHSLAKL
jgi:riboflavin biosynthesis pyrimidine reductase